MGMAVAKGCCRWGRQAGIATALTCQFVPREKKEELAPTTINDD